MNSFDLEPPRMDSFRRSIAQIYTNEYYLS